MPRREADQDCIDLVADLMSEFRHDLIDAGVKVECQFAVARVNDTSFGRLASSRMTWPSLSHLSVKWSSS